MGDPGQDAVNVEKGCESTLRGENNFWERVEVFIYQQPTNCNTQLKFQNEHSHNKNAHRNNS